MSRPGKLYVEQLIYALADMALACSQFFSRQVVDASGCTNCSVYPQHSVLQALNSHVSRGFCGCLFLLSLFGQGACLWVYFRRSCAAHIVAPSAETPLGRPWMNWARWASHPLDLCHKQHPISQVERPSFATSLGMGLLEYQANHCF